MNPEKINKLAKELAKKIFIKTNKTNESVLTLACLFILNNIYKNLNEKDRKEFLILVNEGIKYYDIDLSCDND